LADLLMQLSDDLLAFVRHRLATLEQLGHPIPYNLFPLRHQQRMHLVLPGDLRSRFHSHHRLKSHLRLEGSAILFAFAFHRSALSHVEQTSKSLA